MPDDYIEVTIGASGDLADNLTAILSQIGFEGFWDDDGLLRCYIRKNRWSAAFESEVRHIIVMIQRSASSPLSEVTVQPRPAANWNEAWEKTIKPIAATKRIIIRPRWQTVEVAPGQIEILIEPKMSFGTGYHETTRLSLRLLEEHVRTGQRILDVGTGTGVLAIAAAKLGASEVTGVDIDEWSYDNARENVGLNRVAEQVRLLHGPLTSVPEDRFDVILGNIQRDVLLLLLPEMERRLAADGTLILSGLLLSDRDEFIRDLLSRDILVDRIIEENEWLALSAHRGHGE